MDGQAPRRAMADRLFRDYDFIHADRVVEGGEMKYHKDKDGFGFSVPTLPKGITQEDLDSVPIEPWNRTKRHEAILALTRLHVHQYGMRHCPPYRKMMIELSGSRKTTPPTTPIKMKTSTEKQLSNLVDEWRNLARSLQDSALSLHQCNQHAAERMRVRAQTFHECANDLSEKLNRNNE